MSLIILELSKCCNTAKDAEQFKSWIKSQPQQLDQYKMVILENLLIEKLESDLKSKVKVIKFTELANK